MNTFIHVWSKFLLRKPVLVSDDARIEITASELKKLCQKFYDRGAKDAAVSRPSIFEQLFGNTN